MSGDDPCDCVQAGRFGRGDILFLPKMASVFCVHVVFTPLGV